MFILDLFIQRQLIVRVSNNSQQYLKALRADVLKIRPCNVLTERLFLLESERDCQRFLKDDRWQVQVFSAKELQSIGPASVKRTKENQGNNVDQNPQARVHAFETLKHVRKFEGE